MAKIKPFRALRPDSKSTVQVAELPYDVVSHDEVLEIAGNNPKSFFHITRPEMDLDKSVDPYSEEVYSKGRENLDLFMKEKTLLQDENASFYLYTQVMNGKAQTGIVIAVSIDDYLENVIKKHELTREDKENDRTRHLDILNANTGPVFMIYRESDEKKALIKKAMEAAPVFSFTADDGIEHIGRKIEDETLINDLITAFKDDELYIADGHHRAASAARVGVLRREKNKDYDGTEEFNSFLSVIFPHDELQILSYNRAVRDLNGLTQEEYLAKVQEKFTVTESGIKVPENVHEFSMYMNRKWFTVSPNFDIPSDPVEELDVTIVQKNILDPLLGITDPRKSKKIDFIGGIRGAEELEKLVNSGDYAVAFYMYPTGVDQLIDVSDSGKIMPPKSTWFEPKLRSGLFVHLLD